jgi:GGDEF domain-containing protein
VVIVFHDATERRRVARKLSHEASHDALTGLVGRRGFEERIARVLAEAATGAAEHALCYMDLDRFKVVNDLRPRSGDDLLEDRPPAEQSVAPPRHAGTPRRR